MNPTLTHYGLAMFVATMTGVAVAIGSPDSTVNSAIAIGTIALALCAPVFRIGYLYVLAATGALALAATTIPMDYHPIAATMVLLFWMFVSAFHLFATRWGGGTRWYDPFPSFLLLYFVYSFCGLGVFILRDLYWYNWPADIQVAGTTLAVGMAAVIGGYAFATTITLGRPNGAATASTRAWDVVRLRRAVYVTLVVGAIGAYFVFDRFRTIPLFAPDTELARIYINRNSPKLFWPLWNLLMQTVPLTYLLYCLEGRRALSWVRLVAATALSIGLLSLYGGRSMFLFPVILTFLVYVHERRRQFTLTRAAVLGAGVFVFAMLFIGFRSQQAEYDLTRARNFMIADFFPEVRTFALAAHQVPDLRVGTDTLGTVVVGLIPSGLLALVGVDKAEFWKPIGSRVLAELDFSGILGMRMSLVGELYFMAGWSGVALVMALLGAWLRVLDLRVRSARTSAHRYPYVVTGLLTALLIPYGTIYFISLVWVATPAFVIAWYCRQNPGGVAGPRSWADGSPN